MMHHSFPNKSCINFHYQHPKIKSAQPKLRTAKMHNSECCDTIPVHSNECGKRGCIFTRIKTHTRINGKNMELCRNLIITENKMVVNTKKKAPILGPFAISKQREPRSRKPKGTTRKQKRKRYQKEGYEIYKEKNSEIESIEKSD